MRFYFSPINGVSILSDGRVSYSIRNSRLSHTWKRQRPTTKVVVPPHSYHPAHRSTPNNNFFPFRVTLTSSLTTGSLEVLGSLHRTLTTRKGTFFSVDKIRYGINCHHSSTGSFGGFHTFYGIGSELPSGALNHWKSFMGNSGHQTNG